MQVERNIRCEREGKVRGGRKVNRRRMGRNERVTVKRNRARKSIEHEVVKVELVNE